MALASLNGDDIPLKNVFCGDVCTPLFWEQPTSLQDGYLESLGHPSGAKCLCPFSFSSLSHSGGQNTAHFKVTLEGGRGWPFQVPTEDTPTFCPLRKLLVALLSPLEPLPQSLCPAQNSTSSPLPTSQGSASCSHLISVLRMSESVSRSVTPNSLQSYGLWPARLHCPCDSPGKNTGVGSHSLLQKIFPTQGSNP